MLPIPKHSQNFRLKYVEPVKVSEAPQAQQSSGTNLTTSSSPRSSVDGPRQRKCVGCGEFKAWSEFPEHSSNADGVASYCRQCKNDLAKERRLRDPIARIKHYTVTRIKNEWPKGTVPKDIQTNIEGYLGYRLVLLVKHLREELKAREGITIFEAFKRKYHLDHIKPHSSFDSKTIGDAEFQRCWAIDNLMLIPATDNLKKGAKQAKSDYIIDMEEIDD